VEQSDSPLRHYLQILRRQAWLLVLVPVVALVATYLLLESRKPVYRAATTMVVGEPRGKDFPPVLGSGSVTRTMTNLLESDLVARTVISDLKLDMTNEEFLKKLRVEVLPDTSVLNVAYETTDRKVGLAVVERIAQIFTRQLDETLGVQSPGERSLPGTRSFDLIVRVFDAPHVEPDPVQRNKVTTLAFVGIASFVLALMLAIARDALDRRIRSTRDAEGWFNAPVLGALPRGIREQPPPGVGPARGWRGRRDAEREASLELLRARLEYTQAGPRTKVVVTSAAAREGKSAVAASLSATLARDGKRVVCVDADMRRPGLHRYLGLEVDAPGLADVLKAGVDLEDALVSVDLDDVSQNGGRPSRGRLEVLPAGTESSRSAGPLSPEAAAGLVELLENRADYVVLDAPPLLAADAFPLAAHSDNLLVVARCGRTTRDEAEAIRATLEDLGVTRVGVVLTDASPGAHG
jgi:Mrp family chromosome partitioning ATPase/capsular polysaccharide biosynthesis protein